MNSDHYRLAEQYGKNCGKWSLVGSALDGSETRYHRMNCKCWDCAHCAPRKAARYKKAIIDAAVNLKLTRFLTLTLDPKKLDENISGKEAVRHLRNAFNKLRVYWGRKFGESVKYVAVVEFQENGMPHLHLVIDRYMEVQWIKNTWQKLGGGEQVFIEKSRDLHRVAGYLAKYLTKELLMSAPKGLRRVTCSRGITLLEKAAKSLTHIWSVSKRSIFWLHYCFEAVAEAVKVDDWQILLSFVVPQINQPIGEGLLWETR